MVSLKLRPTPRCYWCRGVRHPGAWFHSVKDIANLTPWCQWHGRDFAYANVSMKAKPYICEYLHESETIHMRISPRKRNHVKILQPMNNGPRWVRIVKNEGQKSNDTALMYGDSVRVKFRAETATIFNISQQVTKRQRIVVSVTRYKKNKKYSPLRVKKKFWCTIRRLSDREHIYFLL